MTPFSLRPTAAALLAVLALLATGCTLKDPKFSAGAMPDPAAAGDAMMMIDPAGETTILGAMPSLCGDPRFGRAAPARGAGAVTIPCWDGSAGL